MAGNLTKLARVLAENRLLPLLLGGGVGWAELVTYSS